MHRTDYTALPKYWSAAAEVTETCDRLLDGGDFFGREEDERAAHPELTDFNCAICPAYMHVDLKALGKYLSKQDVWELIQAPGSCDMSGQMYHEMYVSQYGKRASFDIIGAILVVKDKLPTNSAHFRISDADRDWLMEQTEPADQRCVDYRELRIQIGVSDVHHVEVERQQRVWSVDAAKLLIGQPLDADLTMETAPPIRAWIDECAAVLCTLSIPYGWEAPGINTLLAQMIVENVWE